MIAPSTANAETTPSWAVIDSDACFAAFAEEMRKRSLATGHGDKIEDLHREMWWQFDERMSQRPSCRWSEDEEGHWDTACGECFVFETGGPKENKARWCPYCGGELIEIRYFQQNP